MTGSIHTAAPADASKVDRPFAAGYTARINDTLLRLAVTPQTPLTIQSAPLEPPKVNTATSAEDLSNDFGSLFTRFDFSGGEGLDFAHRPNADPTRYWDSEHIDVSGYRPGQPRTIRLLHETSNIESSTDTNLDLAWDGTALYMAEGNTIRRSTDPTAGTPSFSDDDPHAAEGAVTVDGICGEPGIVYAALGANGIHKRSSGTWAHFSDYTADNVWCAKGFVIASDANVLVEAAAGAGSTTLVTLPDDGVWNDVADAGTHILATASNGYIYALADDGMGALELKSQTFIGTGLEPQGVAAAHGDVFYTTTDDTPAGGVIGRWWRSTLLDNGELSNATLIRQWGAEDTSDDYTPHSLVSTLDAVYVGVPEASASYLWRYDLITGGRSRHLDMDTTGSILSVTVIEKRLFAAVSGAGLLREEDTFETDGYIIGPLGDFSTSTEKSWVGAFIDTEDVADGTVSLYYSTDPGAILDDTDASWIRVKRVSSSVTNDETETRIGVTESRYIAGMVKIEGPTDGSTSPEIRGFGFRGYQSETDVLVELPVNVSDHIERKGRRRLSVKGRGDVIWEVLKTLEGDQVELTLYEPSQFYRGTIAQVSNPITSITHRGSPMLVATLRFRGRRASMSGGASAFEALGVGTMGVAPMGGG